MMNTDLKNTGRALSEEEFGRLFSKCRPFYITIANSYVHNTETAADLVHDSFAKLWERRTELRTGNFEAWLFETVTNRCLDWLRSKETRDRILRNMQDVSCRMLLHEMESLKRIHPETVYAREMEEIIGTCIEKMPTLTRNVFVGHRFENKTYRELAEEFGITPRRVTAEIQAALKMLRVSLKDYINVLLVIAALHFLHSAPGIGAPATHSRSHLSGSRNKGIACPSTSIHKIQQPFGQSRCRKGGVLKEKAADNRLSAAP